MVRLIHHHQVPGLGFLEHLARPIAASHQERGCQHKGFAVPGVTRHLSLGPTLQCRRRVPAELLAIVDWPVEIELLAQLDLPLPKDHRRGQHEHALHPAGERRLTQQQTRLDGLAEADLVGDQQLRRPMIVHPLERPNLMRPRLDRAGGFAHPLAAVRHRRGAMDERPDRPPEIERGRLWLGRRKCLLVNERLGAFLQPPRQRVRLGQESQQAFPQRLGHVDYDRAACGVRPQPGEVVLVLVDVLRPVLP